MYDFQWSQRGSTSFLKRMRTFGNHKCTISVPFLSKYRPIRIHDLGVAWGGSAPVPLRKMLYFVNQICIISGPFWSKFTEIYMISGGRKGQPFFSKKNVYFFFFF